MVSCTKILSILAGISATCSANFIQNGNFESNLTSYNSWSYGAIGWFIDGDAGNWHPNVICYNSNDYSGNNVGFVQSGWVYPAGKLSQYLYSMKSGYTYTFNFDYATRLDNPLPFDGFGYTITDIESGTVLSSNTFSGFSRGDWRTYSTSFSLPFFVGRDYSTFNVSFYMTGRGQINLDDINMGLHPTPTPGSIAMIIVGGLVINNRKREQCEKANK